MKSAKILNPRELIWGGCEDTSLSLHMNKMIHDIEAVLKRSTPISFLSSMRTTPPGPSFPGQGDDLRHPLRPECPVLRGTNDPELFPYCLCGHQGNHRQNSPRSWRIVPRCRRPTSRDCPSRTSSALPPSFAVSRDGAVCGGLCPSASVHQYYRVDMIPHSRPTLDQDEVNAVARVLQSGQVAQGEEVFHFERAWLR